MPTPTTVDIPYGDTTFERFDWYQATGGTPPPDGKPWILITPIEGFRGGGKLAVRTPGRSFYELIKFFIDDRVLNGLATPFDIFVADGGMHLPATEPDPFNTLASYPVHAPESFYQYMRCFQFIRTIMRDEPTRFPNCDPDSGGYAGWSSGGSVSMVCAYTRSLQKHSRLVRSPYTNQYVVHEANEPAFLINWSGGNDYRVGAQVVNNNIGIFSTLEGDSHTRSIPEDLLNAISGITLVTEDCPPTFNIYDDSPAQARPLTDPHNQTQGIELHAALQAVGVYSELHTKSIVGDFADSLDPNIDIPKIYDFIVGPNVLNLEP